MLGGAEVHVDRSHAGCGGAPDSLLTDGRTQELLALLLEASFGPPHEGIGGNNHRHRRPNYLSIMNYSFQMPGLRFNGADGLLDYSRFHLPLLNENALNEPIGLMRVAGIANYGTRYYAFGGGTALGQGEGRAYSPRPQAHHRDRDGARITGSSTAAIGLDGRGRPRHSLRTGITSG